MQSSQIRTLHTVCKRYGPGRLPHAEKNDIGAGYAAAAAAVIATLLYGAVISAIEIFTAGIEGAFGMVFFFLALPFVVPAAFLVGVISWRLLPSYSTPIGIVGGGLGSIATYLVATVLFGALLTAMSALSLTGADPISAITFSYGLLATAFVLTWWVTIPIGCLAGYVHVNVVNTSN
ncbi:hypothetical protein [Halomicrobium katesii]|uniref:hypothetical protein n=1 Tax=Halomicrobium katesii TaxID=437163 RepID=UPI0009B5B001|nr:hypothetical protein [Halomicrobium katesii]